MNDFRRLIAGSEPVFAPLVFNPISAMLAEAAGFKALYLGGGSMGYIKGGTEAQLRRPRWISAPSAGCR
jgi:2-methylisocitrate lyase-like PEP mutase family enzyme